MDDSEQDFVDLCSKLLKRVRKKPGEPRQPRKAEQELSSQANEGDKKRRNNKKHAESGSKVIGTQAVGSGTEELVVNEGIGHGSGDAGSSVVPLATGPRPERGLTAKDKVLLRMQQFKRASPLRMMHTHKSLPTNDGGTLPQPQMQENPESFSSGLHPELQDSDEALALRLQQELDKESAETQTEDLNDGRLFFCQICQKDLSHMTPAGRTQHLNRCLDESEGSTPAPPPPPGVPECPICGKKFKSQKSRSAHLKRCSSDMGVSPAVLLQALQRQAEETQDVTTADTLAQTAGTKRKGPSKQGLPAKKKPKKKTTPLDEDTLVALALSSSLLEQEKEQQRDREAEIQLQAETAVFHTYDTVTPGLKWRPDLGKGRGKKKKGHIPRPPPLLLVQDAQEALRRLQERVSALLLCSRPNSPPTPTRCPSSLAGQTGAAPLWQKSALLDRGSMCLLDWYAPELRQFITPWEPTKTDAASTNSSNKPDSSLQPASEGTPATETRASILPSSSQTASCSSASSTPGLRQHTVGSQTLRDLVELAEDGMTLTQCGYTAAEPNKDLRLSGFVLEDADQEAVLCASGFVPDKTDQSGAVKGGDSHQSAELSRLASDLRSMVNNPQLSDVQLQVDSGEVYFAHSFMVYARCPLLAEMVYESGFGVQEEGMRAQRVLMSDIPGQAVSALLQYLYTGHCSIPASLRLHVLELASRFDLQELQQLCELQQDEADHTSRELDGNNQTDQAFMELLRSMWNEEDEGEEETDTDGGRDEEIAEDHRGDELASAGREISEERVNEEELEEIYEFAATQRNKVEEEEEEGDEENQEDVFTNLAESKRGSSKKSPKLKSPLESELDASLERSYSRLFSGSWGVYEEGDSPSTSGLSRAHPPRSQPFHRKSSELSGRTLLQSSASVVDDISSSPPPSTSNLPVPGVSPGQVGDCGSGGDAADLAECPPLKRESQGPSTICDLPQHTKKEEPELIVLTDSSEEMEVVLSSRSPSPHPPCTAWNPQSYTHIKSSQMPKPNKSTCNNTTTNNNNKVELNSLESGSRDQMDCSPEVSWLIPSTPVQPGRSMRTSSSQTKSSMCRTRLFPKDDASSPSPVFSSPAVSADRLQTSNSPNSASTHGGLTEASVSMVKLDRIVSHSVDIDLTFSPGSYNASKDREVFAVPLSQCKVSHLSSSLQAASKQATPLHLQPQPYSSTPLHTDLHQPPGHLATTPLHTDPNIKTDGRREREASGSPEKTELGSFRLSPLSDPLDQSCSFPYRGSQRQSRSISERQHSIATVGRNTTEDKDQGNKCEQETAERKSRDANASEYSFQRSFMDEPPIAFDDSWGLDACVEENPGCFSLRLEDSGGSSKQERSLGEGGATESSPSTSGQPPPSSFCVQSSKGGGSMAETRPPLISVQAHTGPPLTPSPPDPTTSTTPQINNSLLQSHVWDSWEEEEEEDALPLSQRVNPHDQLKTPASSLNKKRRSLVPITPMPHYSDMDTPELKNKLNRFGVRPLPKRQMVLKLREIHQYTHQLVHSDSEDEAGSVARTATMIPRATSSAAAGKRPISCTQRVKFKEPKVPAAISPVKQNEEEEPLSASQGSNTSSTAASEESERSNPELCLSSSGDSDSDGRFSASQAANRLEDRLRAVRSYILSNSDLYGQILQYQPLVLSQLQERLKAAGIRLGAAKLVDYLDSLCVTFTTAKPGQPAPSRRLGKKTGKRAKASGESGVSRKKGATALI